MLKCSALAAGASLLAEASAGVPSPGAAQTFLLPWEHQGERLSLALHRQPAAGDVVLYVHGATFPSALAVRWQMQGLSWMDDLQRAGLDAWALDFAGYGDSARPAAFSGISDAAAPFGRCVAAADQIAMALQCIRGIRPHARIHLVAHSWGTLPAQQAVLAHPGELSRLVLFGPVVTRDGPAHASTLPAWTLMDEAAQRPRQRTGIPDAVATPVDDAELDRWCHAYLASDASAAQRTPVAVKIPNGPAADVAACWAGQALLDTSLIQVPVLIVRGEWDHVTTDADAGRLFNGLSSCTDKRDIKISGGNHWLHLQPRRAALWAAVRSFLHEP